MQLMLHKSEQPRLHHMTRCWQSAPDRLHRAGMHLV